MAEYVAEVVTTYVQMKGWRDRFAREDGVGFLIVVGSPGTAKSRMFQDGIAEGTLYLSGALSAFHLYTQLYEHLDQPVVFDDVDSIFKDRAAVNLLKCLCNTDARKTVFWGKRNKLLEDEAIPVRFETASRVCVLVNTLDSVEANLLAVIDRAFVVRFEPPVHELHREVGTWFSDPEVYDFVGGHLHLIQEPSMRPYLKAQELKRLGGDWRAYLLTQWTAGDPKLLAVAQIVSDPTLLTAEQRVERFAALCGGSRATYMRKQAQWRQLMGWNKPPRLGGVNGAELLTA